MHSDEDAPLPAPTADTLTTSVCYGDLLNSFSSSDDASSDVLSDNPTRRPPIVPQVEVDASHLTLNPSFHSQGDPINGDMAGPSLNPFIGDEFHDGSTTDNFEDVGVPDSSEDVAVPDKDLCSSSDDSSSEGSTSDVAVPDNSEAVAAAVPGIQMHENRQTSSSQISNTSNFQPPRRRRTAPAYFDDPESIGARVAKRSRASTAPIELAKPLDVTNYIKEVSARLLTERVSQQAFLQFSIASNRAVQKAIASSKRALGEAPK
ncbi:Hypothetical predicted protein [Drosophila guanche]|uniref:Uncharacterized protein n=1 Tax=Drosophila guanche TaxID=7266 RepID=A0A3B0KF39_DROGU|nr:Hypothetical predicted protein [Drosophila guanche]